jgi:regulator of protease activity HflC (stomatin/prohibitin superfamily)
MFDRLIEALLTWIGLFKFWVVVDPYVQGWIVRLGRPAREVGPGIHLLAPFRIEVPALVDMRPSTDVLDAQSIACSDGQPVVVRGVVTWQAADAYKYYFEVFDGRGAVQDAAIGCIGDVCRSLTRAEVLNGQGQAQALKAIRARARRWGIKVVDVQFADLAAARSLRLWQTQTTSAGQE